MRSCKEDALTSPYDVITFLSHFSLSSPPSLSLSPLPSPPLSLFSLPSLPPPLSLLSSYHQKYLLRQQRDILRELNLTESELITSYTACRLNGYCGGYGTVRAFDEEAPSFKLSPSAQERVRKIVARGSLH